MRRDEIAALGSLMSGALSSPAGLARDLHDAVAARVFGALGPLGAPTQLVHDGVSRAAYRAVDAGLRAPLAGAAEALARRAGNEGPALTDSLAGAIALGALNGAVGDALARDRQELALPLELRRHGRPVPTNRADLARVYGDATPKLAVFVHGLCETEQAWRPLAIGADAPRPSYGSMLRRDHGYTPLYIRYNSGLHISDNGRRLSVLLDRVVREWPIEVKEIAVIGHSMGGLVARSACHYGEGKGASWTQLVRHVFCLGTPHLGAPLEKTANVAGWALGRLPETRPLAALVNGRSAGIKDLRFGSCVEEEWCECDPDELLRDRCREVPFLPNAAYYFIGATVASTPEHPLGQIVGDLLVRFPSAAGKGRRRRIPFEVKNGRHLGGLNHFQLLNHPAVYAELRRWLTRGPASLETAPTT
jgi:pimeloyl-ACP methyl ester carboxylesterase